MELSEDIKQSVSRCGNISEINNDVFDEMLHSVASLVEKDVDTDHEKEIGTNISNLSSSLCLFLTEASKKNLEPSSLYTLLDDLNWNPERITLFQNFYESKKPQIRWKLTTCTSFPPQIVDIDWKVDYVSKTNAGTAAGSLFYLITLHLQKTGGEIEALTFKCTLAELTHLVTRLRQASRCIQKYATTQT